MLQKLFFVLLLACPSIGLAQLSKGEGEMATIPGKTIRCYRPDHFVIQAEPPGVIHKETGTFIVAVKVPPEKRVSIEESLPQRFFEDSRYTITSFQENKLSSFHHQHQGKIYTMLYTIQNFEFERHTMIVNVGRDQYMIIGNYYAKFKPQVVEEVKKVMANFIIR